MIILFVYPYHFSPFFILVLPNILILSTLFFYNIFASCPALYSLLSRLILLLISHISAHNSMLIQMIQKNRILYFYFRKPRNVYTYIFLFQSTILCCYPFLQKYKFPQDLCIPGDIPSYLFKHMSNPFNSQVPFTRNS